MSELKLKNCPFCGGSDIHGPSIEFIENAPGYGYTVFHVGHIRGLGMNCGASVTANTADNAIERWNRRAQPEATKPAQDLSAAILALPLPEPFHDKIAIHGVPYYSEVYLRARLSEAAALAEQVQGQQWISVKDRLPETLVYDARPCKVDGREIPPAIRSHKVLVSLSTGVVREDYLDGLQGGTPFWSNFRDSVIAWQPMPPAAAPSIAQDGQKSEADDA